MLAGGVGEAETFNGAGAWRGREATRSSDQARRHDSCTAPRRCRLSSPPQTIIGYQRNSNMADPEPWRIPSKRSESSELTQLSRVTDESDLTESLSEGLELTQIPEVTVPSQLSEVTELSQA